MSSAFDAAKKQLSLASLGLDGLEMIAELAGTLVGHPEVGAVAKTIVAIVEAIQGGASGKLTMAQVEDGLTSLRALEAAADAAADTDLDNRFK